uniref:Uncharacterized protein n=1 Tax=Amphimedon queenslandica TaxID=400682 RepID=A0A1X7T863_AMPQE
MIIITIQYIPRKIIINKHTLTLSVITGLLLKLYLKVFIICISLDYNAYLLSCRNVRLIVTEVVRSFLLILIK